MKKYFLIPIIFLTMPVFALCSISQEGMCKLSDNNEGLPVFQNKDINIESQTINNNLQIQPPDSFLNRTKDKKGVMIESSLGCQFGKCSHGLNNDFLENQ